MQKKMEIKETESDSSQAIAQSLDSQLIGLYIDANQVIYRVLFFCLGMLVGNHSLHIRQGVHSARHKAVYASSEPDSKEGGTV